MSNSKRAWKVNCANEKKAQKIDKLLNGIKSKYSYKEENQYIMPDIKYEQKKVDEIIQKELLKYQDIWLFLFFYFY